MNCRYFACIDHHEYVDAGYRWAFWTLEDADVVHLDHDVDVERLLAASEYWNPPAEEGGPWLSQDILPTARSFLRRHAGHRLVYVEEDRLITDSTHGGEWRQIERYDDGV